jgi:poly(3-hydroxybutyrate) depolymerase
MPTGPCPDFVQGDVTFQPAGGMRKVAITMTDASRTISGGPLVFYWFATTSSPIEARRGLPLADVTAAGGIVVAPYDVPNAGTYPWLSQLTQHDALFDEVLACAVQKTKISTARVHALGFSAGALMTTHLSFARSKYLASVATYSGGAMGQFQETNNKFAAMIMTGGMGDIVVNNFYTSSQAWQKTLKDAGHFAMFCDHGGGHSIPTRLVPGVWQFFVDHPYGRVPSPYQGHLPAAIAPPCVE